MPKHVVITGASSGFGWAMTERFLNQGWQVHATSRSGTLENTKNLSPEHQTQLHIYPLDLAQDQSRKTFLNQVMQNTSQIDVLVNNAGFGLFGALEDLSEEQMRRIMDVNFLGATLITQAMLPLLRKSKGHIINFSSVLGFSGLPMTSFYCASKYALEGWSEALKYELSPFNVKVTLVQPGAHRTRFGVSVEWGEKSFDEASAFYPSSKRYKAFLEKLRQRPNPAKPDYVADRICKIAGTEKPPFKLRFGKDAAASYWMRRILPAGLVLKLMNKVYGRLLMQNPVEVK